MPAFDSQTAVDELPGAGSDLEQRSKAQFNELLSYIRWLSTSMVLLAISLDKLLDLVIA